MRIPSDLTADPSPRRRHRARWWIVGFVVVLIVLLVSLRSLAGLYTDSLWFSSVGYHNVFSTLLVIKLGLFGVFGAIFFAVLWVNLVVCDRIAGHDIVLAQEDELVRRYQQYVRPYAGRIYVALAFVLALIGASGTIGQWNNWILFRHGGNFGVTDPQFHKDVGFYVFKLPFLTFVVDWTLAILIVTLAVSVVFHYFNGGIQPQRGLPRVRPPVKAHISVLLALIALDKAAGYVLQRWSLVNAQDGYVNGAGYTDVHARLPAELLLVYVSIFAAAILLFNIRRQGWTLPVLAVGIWAFVALVVGIIYPALLQALKVTPAQSSLEAPYIQRNITATRDAYDLNNVQGAHSSRPTRPSARARRSWPAHHRQHPPVGPRPLDLAADVPAPAGDQVVLHVPVARRRPLHARGPAHAGADRRARDLGREPAVPVVGQHPPAVHPRQRRGRGAGQPDQLEQPGLRRAGRCRRPRRMGMPAITQPNVYFGLGETGYVVANTKQPRGRLPAERQRVESHYKGTGGVQLSSLFTRAAFALRLGDFNLLISSQITDKSRIMFVRDPVAMAQKAAPFLSFDHDPYAVINDGHIDWVVDGYTTTSNYPYSQNASTQQVAVGSNLPGSYNYVRNSVKVVIDAYSGQMTFYDVDPNDPILQAYSAAFPHMFTPLSKMSPQLQAHLRYPPDIFSIQSAIYGRYHLTNPQAFYAASNAWQLSPTAGAGPQSQALLAENTYNNQGQLVSTTPARMAPQYQVYSLPGTPPTEQVFTVSDGFVPASQSTLSGTNQNFNLTAWMVGLSDPAHYGQLNLYETPQGTTGPANADAEISANNDGVVGHHAAGPARVGGAAGRDADGPDRQLDGVPAAALRGGDDQPAAPAGVRGRRARQDRGDRHVAVGRALRRLQDDRHGAHGPRVPSTGTVPAAVASILQPAQTDYTNAQTALKAGNLAQYQADIQLMEQADQQAQQVLGTPRRARRRRPRPRPRRRRRSRGRSRSKDGTRPPRPSTDDHGADEHRAERSGARRPRRRRWPRRRRRCRGRCRHRGSEPADGPASSRLRPAAAGPMMAGAKRATKGGARWDCSTRSRHRRPRRPRRPRTRRPRARRRSTRHRPRRRPTGMLRDLGAAFYATKTGRATPTTDADIERLVAALQQHESEHGRSRWPPSPPRPPRRRPRRGRGRRGRPSAPAAPAGGRPASPPPPPPTAQTL